MAGRNAESRQERWALAGAPDPLVLFFVGLLMTIGAVMVYSSSVRLDQSLFETRAWWDSPLKQCVFTIAGFAAMVFASRIDYRLFAWEKKGDGWWAGSLALLAVALLAAVLIPGIGVSRLGAQRSIVLMTSPLPLGFQPSEFAKLAMLVWLAALLTRPGVDPKRLRTGYLPALGSAGLMIALTGIEDFGTAALMGVVMACVLFLAGASWLHLVGTAMIGFAGGALLVLKEEYRVRRLVTFFSENPNPADEGFQVTQSLIAIASGGWWGAGLGNGIQKYDYLPQDNNDFIFAVLCEELGIAGGMVVILAFICLIIRGWQLSVRCSDPFGRLLAAGVTLMIGLQAAFNIGVVTNSIPTKGISLPFVSAGGSGVVFLGLAAGVLSSIGRTRRVRVAAEPLGDPAAA